MAEELDHPAKTVQHENDTNDKIMERGKPLKEDTNGHEEQGEASYIHSRPLNETSIQEEDEAHRTNQPEIRTSPQAFRCWNDSSQSSEVEDYIYEAVQPSTLGPQIFKPEDADCGAWASPSNPRCPASFGDHGTTATAGAYGQLIQFSDYLGAGNSGVCSAGNCLTPEPYFVTPRAQKLHSLASSTFELAQTRPYDDSMFGLKFLDLELLRDTPPSLKWFQYQWPRYEYEGRCFKGMQNVGLTIQFIVRDRTVFQQCILENRGETDIDLQFAFCKGMRIWDLDHVTDDYGFNETIAGEQNAGPGPGGFGWVHVNRFHEGSPGARTDSQHWSRGEDSNNGRGNLNKNGQTNYGVALVISMAVGGEVIRFKPGQSSHIWKQTLKAISRTPGCTSQVLEIVTAYKLILLTNPLSDWKTFVVPLREMNPNRFLREARATSLLRTSISRISKKGDSAHIYNRRHSETHKDEETKVEGGIVNVSQDGVAAVDGGPRTEPSPAVDHEPMPEKTSPTLDHIEFAVRRNLEHILGVCAIPVAVRVSAEDSKESIWEKLRDVQPIALSCGDMSGHRICTTSSFFAFQFLVEVAKRLGRLPRPDRDHAYVQALLTRIKDVCLGHLKWLFAVEKTDQDGAFKSLYWASGEAVSLPESSDSWAPREHVLNTAFQILKAAEFANSFCDDEDGDWSLIGEMISHWGHGWVRWLERSDRRESLTWYHKEDEELKIFRLDDQVWIWRALKAMEDKRLGAWAILYDRAQRKDRSSSTGSEASHVDEILRRSRKFASQAVQREVLRKFTTKHEILRKDLIALTRSPRETRFLFHARDTALFYGQDIGSFAEGVSFREEWKNTIDAQRFHENNQEARWDNALRYALSIMLGVKGHQINNTRPGQMVQAATEVLLQSSSENGLFPGKLDTMTKRPLEDVFHAEKDADSYYAAGFEIPYIFLIHAKEIGALVDSADPGLERGDVDLRHRPTKVMPAQDTSNLQVQVDQREKDEELHKLLTRLSGVLSALPYHPNSASAFGCTGPGELAVDGRHALKKCIPLSITIDSHSIFEIEDEWLFDYPDFFGSKEDKNTSIDTTLDSLKELEVNWPKSIDVTEMRGKYSSSHNNKDSGAENQSEASSYSASSVASESLRSIGAPGDSGLRILDIPRRKRLQGKGPPVSSNQVDPCMGSLKSIWERIKRPRTVAKAKKRLILWSRQGTDPGLEAALLCYAASKGDERAYMLEFFERHFQHENFMFDYCKLANNTWETELHLSFFILGDTAGPLSGKNAHNVEKFPGAQGKHISRGSVGFRFQGDAFDRYWTFHMFTNLDLEELEDTKESHGRAMTTSEILLFQRKDLELRFFSKMLNLVESHTEHILAEVKSELGIKSGSFSWSTPSMDRYSSWSTLWEGFAPLIQALADDLSSTQDIISQWDAREGSRGQERPRWTLNDERKYRAAISRSQRLLNWRKKGIQKLLEDVESLRELCTARLANAREELSFRSNQNIASFTYVTIVFLPLGFAASVFSMNGYPAASWVASMVVIAVVTLAITVIALANTKLFLTVADEFSRDAMGITRAVFQSSLIGQHKRQQDERARASPVPNEPAQGDQNGGEPLHNHATRHVLFWMAYLLIELPARRVALACRALPACLMQSLGLLRPDATSPASVGSTGGPSGPQAAAVGWKIIRIAGGILILPLLLVSWTIQILFYNVFDILAFLGRLTRNTFYALVIPRNSNGATTESKMVAWLIDPPSSLRPMRKYMSRDEKSEKPTPQADTPVAADRSDSGPVEDV